MEGIAKAKAAGVYKGKPSIDASAVRNLREEGFGPAAIAKRLKIGRVVYRLLSACLDWLPCGSLYPRREHRRLSPMPARKWLVPLGGAHVSLLLSPSRRFACPSVAGGANGVRPPLKAEGSALQSPKFNRTAYQRDYMRKRRAAAWKSGVQRRPRLAVFGFPFLGRHLRADHIVRVAVFGALDGHTELLAQSSSARSATEPFATEPSFSSMARLAFSIRRSMTHSRVRMNFRPRAPAIRRCGSPCCHLFSSELHCPGFLHSRLAYRPHPLFSLERDPAQNDGPARPRQGCGASAPCAPTLIPVAASAG